MLSWVFSWFDSLYASKTATATPSTVTATQISKSLHELIADGGAGSWPPRATFMDSWPETLKPYHLVYEIVAPLLPVQESSLDDDLNRKLIAVFRARMCVELQRNIDLAVVNETLVRDESGDHLLSNSAWMGFFSCIAYLRHFYRWGISPVVREAQNEKTLSFPRELDTPWTFLQRRFQVTSPGGSLASNVYYNVNEHQELTYSFTVGMSAKHRNTERWSALIVLEMEKRALPLYHSMCCAGRCLELKDKRGTAAALRSANEILKDVLRFFYDNLTDSNISQKLWMAYVQGPNGWALHRVDGTSGGHTLIFRTLDAFLGIKPFPTSEAEMIHIPISQRNWLNTLRNYDIRAVAKAHAAEDAIQQLEHMVQQLRVWRMSHMRRMQPYEGVYRPERKKMTAGKSCVENNIAPDEDAMVVHLKKQLAVRLSQTK